MVETKQYVITHVGTKKKIYSGNNAFKAVQMCFSGSNTKIEFSGKVTEAVFNYIIAVQQRLN